jgi:hypothetical protein
MNWVAWRQHRKQFLIVGIFLAIFAAIMIPTGLNFWHTYQHASATCGATNTCGQLPDELFQSNTDGLLIHLIPIATILVPILLGIFWGVPFLAREYADGTNKLVWTQSVSRKKWLTIKLIWVLVGAAILATGFAMLDTWWSKAINALTLGRFGPIHFETQGIVLIGYAVFAVSLGIFLGALFKRTMVAIGVAIFILIAAIMVIVPNFVRPYYDAPVSDHFSLINNSGGPASPTTPTDKGATLAVSSTVESKNQQPLNWANPPSKCIVTNLPGAGPGGGGIGERQHATKVAPGANGNISIASQNGGPAINMNCLSTLGYQQYITYQPSYRYWDFQRIETGLYLALSVLPLAGTYWLVLRRDA